MIAFTSIIATKGFTQMPPPSLSEEMNGSSSCAGFVTIGFGKDIERMYVAQPIEWTDQGVVMLDQRRLPAKKSSTPTPTIARSPKQSAKW